MEDYRNTEFCPAFENIDKKKNDLKSKIIAEHPKITNFYKCISDKDGRYKKEFLKIYNSKCVYCGNSIKNICIDMFEIDHFINEASCDVNTANQIENLVLSCHACNRAKQGLKIENEYIKLLNPIFINKVFKRIDNYRIVIKNEFNNDAFINTFYEQVRLGKETKRLDYLLLILKGMMDVVKDDKEIYNSLSKITNVLQEKRNKFDS